MMVHKKWLKYHLSCGFLQNIQLSVKWRHININRSCINVQIKCSQINKSIIIISFEDSINHQNMKNGLHKCAFLILLYDYYFVVTVENILPFWKVQTTSSKKQQRLHQDSVVIPWRHLPVGIIYRISSFYWCIWQLSNCPMSYTINSYTLWNEMIDLTNLLSFHYIYYIMR